jgi:hypothetical protein
MAAIPSEQTSSERMAIEQLVLAAMHSEQSQLGKLQSDKVVHSPSNALRAEPAPKELRSKKLSNSRRDVLRAEAAPKELQSNKLSNSRSNARSAEPARKEL